VPMERERVKYTMPESITREKIRGWGKCESLFTVKHP